MNIVDIADRTATVELAAEEAFVLAQACEHGAWSRIFDETPQLRFLVETMGAAFGAFALAAGMRSRVLEGDADECTYRAMCSGKLLDPGYTAVADA